jgi:hypothetical protein
MRSGAAGRRRQFHRLLALPGDFTYRIHAQVNNTLQAADPFARGPAAQTPLPIAPKAPIA